LHTIYNLLDNFEKYIFSEFCYNLKVPFDYIMKNESNDKINELFNEIDAIKLVKVQIFGTKYIKYIEISISKLVSFIKEENNKQFFTDGGESFYKFKPTIKSYIYRQLDIMNKIVNSNESEILIDENYYIVNMNLLEGYQLEINYIIGNQFENKIEINIKSKILFKN
jgi:hypothetical protein